MVELIAPFVLWQHVMSAALSVSLQCIAEF